MPTGLLARERAKKTLPDRPPGLMMKASPAAVSWIFLCSEQKYVSFPEFDSASISEDDSGGAEVVVSLNIDGG